MNEFDDWIYFDGPEPEVLAEAFEALRVPLPEDVDRVMGPLLAKIDAMLASERGDEPAEETRRDVVEVRLPTSGCPQHINVRGRDRCAERQATDDGGGG